MLNVRVTYIQIQNAVGVISSSVLDHPSLISLGANDPLGISRLLMRGPV